MTARYFADVAIVGDAVERDVVFTVDGGVFTDVAPGASNQEAERLPGIVVPGLVNAHSHAFHRALRGCAEGGSGDFWSWRELMYAVAARIEPEEYLCLATAVFVEMALAGVTVVGEFHYLHHRPDGRPYDDPNEMGSALIEAATTAGLGLTLIDTCYLRGGFDAPLQGTQARFGDHDVDAWEARVAEIAPHQDVKVAAGIHSVRAVDAESAREVATWATTREAPLHYHLSEQRAENEQCIAFTGSTPAALLADVGAVTPTATAVHGTHLTDADIRMLGSVGTAICACPSTEQDLADGIGRFGDLAGAGCRLCVGSDGNTLIDILQEARSVEMHERLRTGHRGTFPAREVVAIASRLGAGALGWNAGRLEAGARADLVALSPSSTRTSGVDDPLLAAAFAASAADVTDVVSGGRRIVADGTHLTVGDAPGALAAAVRSVLER
jgi:formiminoglutamate deiminase